MLFWLFIIIIAENGLPDGFEIISNLNLYNNVVEYTEIIGINRNNPLPIYYVDYNIYIHKKLYRLDIFARFYYILER